jgi:uncharacterized membrane protein YphA (DoxX/SURF4 family)
MVSLVAMLQTRAAAAVLVLTLIIYITTRPEKSSEKPSSLLGGLLILKKNQKVRRIIGYIFRAWITRKDGTRDWARDHGYRAWRIPIYEK